MSKVGQFIVLIGMSIASFAVSADGIPDEPLRLSNALEYSNSPHPMSSGAELDVEAAEIDSKFYESGAQWHLEATIIPRRVDRAARGGGNSLSDGYATLRLAYPLHDYGRRIVSKDLANVELERFRHRLEYARAKRKIEIMRRFFDVILADLEYGVQNEKMTLSFLRWNRYVEELEMHEAHAEVDVLALEIIYREEFSKRQEANFNRLNARRDLGLALGITDYVPRDLQTPDLSNYVKREVPEFDVLLEQLLENNYEKKQAEFNLQSVRLAASRVESNFNPQLDLVLETSEWEQETGSRNDASVGLEFRMPFASGDQRKRQRQLRQIAIDRAQSELAEVEHSIRKQAFDLWKALTLHHIDLAAAQVRLNYRDQYMDRARTLYELEERSDLGDAQAELLRASLEDYRVQFNLALTWSEIDALTGEQVFPY